MNSQKFSPPLPKQVHSGHHRQSQAANLFKIFSEMTRKEKKLTLSSPNRSVISSPEMIASPMAEKIEQAEPIILKWDVDSSAFAKVTSLFHENRVEARQFIKSVHNLQKTMRSLLDESSSSRKLLVRAQFLMQTAMKRLQKEFYQILAMNRACLEPESVSARSSVSFTPSSTSDSGGDESEDEIRLADRLIGDVEDSSLVAMADLKLIAECMICCGYGKECVNVYTTLRKSIVDEGLYKLGVEKEKSSKIHKMDWEVLDIKIKNWLATVKIAVKTLFHGERILCDHVFSSSDLIHESVFSEVTKAGASTLFGFPELVVKHGPHGHGTKSPEKIFRMLDMYTAFATHWPEIESIFSFESTSAVVDIALNSTIKLAEWTLHALTDYEASIHKESSKTPVPGAGIHQLTSDVMNTFSLLADYDVLGNIIVDYPPPAGTSLPDSSFDSSSSSHSSDDFQASPISLRFTWLILVLLCKLDGKAKLYKDVSLSYLFLANNLQHVVSKVRTSNLKYIVGDDWISKHEAKVKRYAESYKLLGWSHVIESVPTNPTALRTPEKVKEGFSKFNAMFNEAHQKQSVCVIPDSKLRDEIRMSIARKLLPLYGEFYSAHAVEMKKQRSSAHLVKFTPEDLSLALSDLFFGSGSSSSWFSSGSNGGYSSEN